ncbi:MAG: hypothetical protein NT092_13540 [Bacteroidia bacterium]|nr:hypothetical protein [Bacteroidia bacterium]
MKNSRKILVITIKIIPFILVIVSIILFNKRWDFESLKAVHIEKEKRVGDDEVNRQLYLYNTQTPIEKYIVTDYQYLWILPEISKYFMDGSIETLELSSSIFENESVGYLLWTPSSDNSKQMPEFIEARIESGKYQEIFNYKGYRFIKIR